MSGKLNGEITPTTPCGTRRAIDSRPGVLGSTWPCACIGMAGGELAEDDGFAHLVLALGQDGAGLAGDEQREFVEVLLQQRGGALEDGGPLARRRRGPGGLRGGARPSAALATSARHGAAGAGEHLAGGRLDHVGRGRRRHASPRCRGARARARGRGRGKSVVMGRAPRGCQNNGVRPAHWRNGVCRAGRRRMRALRWAAAPGGPRHRGEIGARPRDFPGVACCACDCRVYARPSVTLSN